MKKVLLTMMCIFVLGTANAQRTGDFILRGQRIQLSLSLTDVHNSGIHHPKAPMRAPEVSIDGYTLLIYSDHPDYIVQLLSDETVVFETYVPSTTYEVELPQDLTGEFELQLQTDNYTFTGFVDL